MQVTEFHPTRKPLRLPNRDYSHAGPYFVTICTHNKSCFLGVVRDEHIYLTPAGQTARDVWYSLPERFSTLVFGEFIIMPNHLHCILAFVGAGLAPPIRVGAKGDGQRPYSLSMVIGAFKSISAIKINRLLKRSGRPVWQRSYYDHIIRDGNDMRNAQRYILENPMRWSMDPEYSAAQKR
jgi:putative transposase